MGGNFDAPPITNSVAVGSASIRFDNCTEGALTYHFTDGSNRSGVIPLTRITTPVGCSESLPQNARPDFYLSGSWYEQATSGQGLLFEVNPVEGRFAASWFTYARNGEAIGGPASQRWYTIQPGYSVGARTLNNMAIRTTTGGVFDDSAPPTTQLVGTASLQFHDCYSATLTYNFTAGSNAGRSGSMGLTRVLAPPGCTG